MSSPISPFDLTRELWRLMPAAMPLPLRLRISLRAVVAGFNLILEWLPRGSHLLDVGFVDGTLLALAARLWDAASLAGVEIRIERVDRARALLASVGRRDATRQLYDGKTLNEQVTKADVVCLVDVLHHVPPESRRDLLAAIGAKMRPGARFILKDDGGSLWHWGNRRHDMVFSREWVREVPLIEQVHMLEAVGFRTLATRSRHILYTPRCVVVAEKPE